MSRRSFISSVTLASLMIVSAMMHAESPGVAPADHTEYSPNHRFFLISSVKEKRTRIFRASNPSIAIWEIPLYLQNADLANDGHMSLPATTAAISSTRRSDSLTRWSPSTRWRVRSGL